MVTKIEERFGEMTVTRGDHHIYLGMDIKFTGDGEVHLLMKDYLLEAAEAFPETITGEIATPAATYLFKVNPDSTLLDVKRKDIFHSITAKLLYVSKRA